MKTGKTKRRSKCSTAAQGSHSRMKIWSFDPEYIQQPLHPCSPFLLLDTQGSACTWQYWEHGLNMVAFCDKVRERKREREGGRERTHTSDVIISFTIICVEFAQLTLVLDSDVWRWRALLSIFSQMALPWPTWVRMIAASRERSSSFSEEQTNECNVLRRAWTWPASCREV